MRRLILPGIFVVALFALLVFRLPGGSGEDAPVPDAHHLEGPAFGTTYSIRWRGPMAASAVKAAVDAVVERVNGSMSTYRPSSELSRLNRLPSAASVTVSADLATVLEAAIRIHDLTLGAFDPTVGPIVDAWGFGPTEVLDPPTAAILDAAKAKVGLSRVRLQGRTLRTAAEVTVDLSAIAKGYAVDEVARALEAAGLSAYLVEIGGELRARGQGPRGPWRIGIERPVAGATQRVFETLALEDAALATSGNYRNFVTVDGRRVTHIIDPRTGEPVAHGLGSVTVIDDDCMTADALATALYVLGAEAGSAWAESKGVAALFLTPKGEGLNRRATTAYQRRVTAVEPGAADDPSSRR